MRGQRQCVVLDVVSSSCWLLRRKPTASVKNFLEIIFKVVFQGETPNSYKYNNFIDKMLYTTYAWSKSATIGSVQYRRVEQRNQLSFLTLRDDSAPLTQCCWHLKCSSAKVQFNIGYHKSEFPHQFWCECISFEHEQSWIDGTVWNCRWFQAFNFAC